MFFRDAYTDFTYRDIRSSSMNVWITNNNDLQFAVTPEFSNTFVEPEFSDFRYFTGANIQKTSLTLNCVADNVTLAEWRAISNWLSPSEQGTLQFDFNIGTHYNVKVSSGINSVTTIRGGKDPVKGDLFIMEFDISFETVGDWAAVSNSFIWEKDNLENARNTRNNRYLFPVLNQVLHGTLYEDINVSEIIGKQVEKICYLFDKNVDFLFNEIKFEEYSYILDLDGTIKDRNGSSISVTGTFNLYTPDGSNFTSNVVGLSVFRNIALLATGDLKLKRLKDATDYEVFDIGYNTPSHTINSIGEIRDAQDNYIFTIPSDEFADMSFIGTAIKVPHAISFQKNYEILLPSVYCYNAGSYWSYPVFEIEAENRQIRITYEEDTHYYYEFSERSFSNNLSIDGSNGVVLYNGGLIERSYDIINGIPYYKVLSSSTINKGKMSIPGGNPEIKRIAICDVSHGNEGFTTIKISNMETVFERYNPFSLCLNILKIDVSGNYYGSSPYAFLNGVEYNPNLVDTILIENFYIYIDDEGYANIVLPTPLTTIDTNRPVYLSICDKKGIIIDGEETMYISMHTREAF